MKRIILFSQPTENNIKQIATALFPNKLQNRIMAYMPSEGNNTKQKYTDFWQKIALDNSAEFLYVDNSKYGKEAEAEKQKIAKANILIITGGNTYALLNNLRKSGQDKAITEFSKKDSWVIAGFSAGAIIISPNISTASQPSGTDPNDLIDENKVGIRDLTALHLVDFEILPHYDDNQDKATLEEYRKKSKYEVKPITDEEVLIIDN